MPCFRATDGVEISYRCWEQESALPLVLLHHGFVASGRTNWEAPGIVRKLVEAGRRVATIDARGHGASGKPHDPAAYGEARMAEDVSTLLDVLDEPAVDLVGYSMGAVVAVLTAVRDHRVRRLVVGGVGASVVELGGVDTRVLPADALLRVLRADDPAEVADSPAASFRAFADAIGGDRLALAAQAAATHTGPIAFDEITARTLVLVGRDDALATRPEVLAEAVPGAVVRRVPGDHTTTLREPEFAEALIDFVNGADTPLGAAS
ncbi:alpha/beta fold hydrolase [Saccharomonospora sp. NB11]|uniref:alpha/beta fold hydrolase n=1 Tax=Saccharomonospora sp. NB11 TaxID=1642298 RepID=UPI0018D1F141|nr:alpha/beta hydrolase [Saccharomonospora sp. NB11]